jgi:hypothetical protein
MLVNGIIDKRVNGIGNARENVTEVVDIARTFHVKDCRISHACAVQAASSNRKTHGLRQKMLTMGSRVAFPIPFTLLSMVEC